MPCQSDERDQIAPSLPVFTTLTKAIGYDGASHASTDAEETKNELDANVEKQFDESTGNKCKYNSYLQYTEVKW
jgi:hypothetical protein